MEKKGILSEFSERVHKRWLMFVLFIADIVAIMMTLVLAFSQLLESYPIIFWLLVASIVLSNTLIVFSYFAFRDVVKERDDFKRQLDSKNKIIYTKEIKSMKLHPRRYDKD
jgi:hypothetical protein